MICSHFSVKANTGTKQHFCTNKAIPEELLAKIHYNQCWEGYF